jgi:hypothetical protein
MFFGAFCLAVGIGMSLDNKADNPAFGFILGPLAFAAGYIWFRSVTGSERRLRHQYQEKQILSVAASHGGIITLAQIKLDTDLDAAEAAEVIDRLCANGLCRADLLDDGTVCYRFGGLLSPGARGD